MGTYVILLRDKNKGSLTDDLLRRHIEHVRRVDEQGRLVLCGPLDDDAQAIQIVRADSIQAVEALVRSDPFIVEKYYGSYELHELIEANESNHWLLDDTQTRMNLGNA